MQQPSLQAWTLEASRMTGEHQQQQQGHIARSCCCCRGASVLYHGGYIVVQRCSLCSEFWWKKKNGRGSCKIQCSRPRLTIATELPKAIVWGKTHIVIWQEKRFPSSHWLFHICLECGINPQKMLNCLSTWFFWKKVLIRKPLYGVKLV